MYNLNLIMKKQEKIKIGRHCIKKSGRYSSKMPRSEEKKVEELLKEAKKKNEHG